MLNTTNEKELFCVVMTHCDANIEFDGEPKILDEILYKGLDKFESFEDTQKALEIYESYFMDHINTYGSTLSNELGLEYKLFKPTSCIP